MDFLVPIFVFVLVFSLCWCCKRCCCERRNEGAIFTTPVIITSETHHTNNGSYIVPRVQPYMQVTNNYTTAQNAYPHAGYAQPPYPQQQQYGAAPYPMPNGQAPYPPPHQGNVPFPNANAPSYPAMMDPPTYEQAVPGRNDSAYQKQSPYNPNFNS